MKKFSAMHQLSVIKLLWHYRFASRDLMLFKVTWKIPWRQLSRSIKMAGLILGTLVTGWITELSRISIGKSNWCTYLSYLRIVPIISVCPALSTSPLAMWLRPISSSMAIASSHVQWPSSFQMKKLSACGIRRITSLTTSLSSAPMMELVWDIAVVCV